MPPRAPTCPHVFFSLVTRQILCRQVSELTVERANRESLEETLASCEERQATLLAELRAAEERGESREGARKALVDRLTAATAEAADADAKLHGLLRKLEVTEEERARLEQQAANTLAQLRSSEETAAREKRASMAARELLVQRDVAIASRDDQLATMTARVARARDAMGEQLSLLETASDAADRHRAELEAALATKGERHEREKAAESAAAQQRLGRALSAMRAKDELVELMGDKLREAMHNLSEEQARTEALAHAEAEAIRRGEQQGAGKSIESHKSHKSHKSHAPRKSQQHTTHDPRHPSRDPSRDASSRMSHTPFLPHM